MKLFLAILLTAVALGLLPGWVRSYWRFDQLAIADDDKPKRGTFVIFSIDGRLFPVWTHSNVYPPGWSFTSAPAYGATNNTRTFLGFGFPRFGNGVGLSVPYWFLEALLVVPAVRIWTRERRANLIAARRQAGECLACGYDLRASGDRCPECGELRQVESCG